MFSQVGGKFSSMTKRKRRSFVAFLIGVPFFAVASFAQESEESNSQSEDTLEISTTQESDQPKNKYTKDYLESLSKVQLTDLLEKCADGLLSITECTSLRSENYRRKREGIPHVDMETIEPSQPFGAVYQSDDDDEKTEFPTLVEVPVSPPSSHSDANEPDTIVPLDPRDVRDRNRDKPPSSIPTYDRPSQRNNDRSESKSEGN